MNYIFKIFLILLIASKSYAQFDITFTTIDSLTQQTLPAVKFVVLNKTDTIRAITNEFGKGTIKIKNLGKYFISFKNEFYISKIDSIEITSNSKEFYYALVERSIITETVTITAFKNVNNNQTGTFKLNIVDAKKIPASLDDPNRLIANSPSVTVTNDYFNYIIVRGNSPSSIIYKVNGIEIPAPNHFATFGSTGGSLSMFQNDALSSIALHTTSFSAEHGNATAGVFELNLRNGNPEKRKHSVQLNLIGFNFVSEGYISKNKKSSYQARYRYSSLGLLSAINVKYNNAPLPTFQDAQLNFNIKSKHFDKIQLWTIFGKNNKFVIETATVRTDNLMFIQGLNTVKKISKNLNLNFDLIASRNTYNTNSKNLYINRVDNTNAEENLIRGQMIMSYKLNEYINTSIGFVNSFKNLQLESTVDINTNISISSKTMDTFKTNTIQAFNNWEIKFNKNISSEFGLHWIYSSIINKNNFNPRVKLKYTINDKLYISASSGIFSKLEPLYVYRNGSLTFSNSKAISIGANYAIFKNLNFKTELYYESLYNIPINYNTILDSATSSSLINSYTPSDNIFRTQNLALGYNKGIEILLEKSIADNWFFSVSNSFFESKYKETNLDNWRNTRFNLRYNINAILGKEFIINTKKNNILGVNIKYAANGGQFYEPVLVEQSQKGGYTVYGVHLTERAKPYSKIDLQISYTHNYAKCVIEYKLDVMNVLNKQNIINQYYSPQSESIKNTYMLGIIPVLSIKCSI
jgi:hypothetical protein